MYSKDELSAKDISELQAIANEMGAEAPEGSNEEAFIYAILDKQAEIESTKNPLTAKRRRTRIVKKDTDRVYTVSGKEGENFDAKKPKTAQTTTAQNPSDEGQEDMAEKTELTPEEMLQAIPSTEDANQRKNWNCFRLLKHAKSKTN